jgi:hypothetical protein
MVVLVFYGRYWMVSSFHSGLPGAAEDGREKNIFFNFFQGMEKN